jgi:hypothetical protein
MLKMGSSKIGFNEIESEQSHKRIFFSICTEMNCKNHQLQRVHEAQPRATGLLLPEVILM